MLLLSLWKKSCSVTIQMKPLWKNFHMILFVRLFVFVVVVV